jgi:hypothetical protein
MNCAITVAPGIPLDVKNDFEDSLDDFLSAFGGTTTGGGTMVDGSESDLEFCSDDEVPADRLYDFIRDSNVYGIIKVRCLVSGNVIFEMNKNKPWWKIW